MSVCAIYGCVNSRATTKKYGWLICSHHYFKESNEICIHTGCTKNGVSSMPPLANPTYKCAYHHLNGGYFGMDFVTFCKLYVKVIKDHTVDLECVEFGCRNAMWDSGAGFCKYHSLKFQEDSFCVHEREGCTRESVKWAKFPEGTWRWRECAYHMIQRGRGMHFATFCNVYIRGMLM